MIINNFSGPGFGNYTEFWKIWQQILQISIHLLKIFAKIPSKVINIEHNIFEFEIATDVGRIFAAEI